MSSTFKLLMLASIVMTPMAAAVADEEVNCEAGQKKVAFADGNNITQVCVDNSDMDATTTNPEVPVGEDPTNTDGHTEG